MERIFPELICQQIADYLLFWKQRELLAEYHRRIKISSNPVSYDQGEIILQSNPVDHRFQIETNPIDCGCYIFNAGKAVAKYPVRLYYSSGLLALNGYRKSKYQ